MLTGFKNSKNHLSSGIMEGIEYEQDTAETVGLQ